jgi:acetyl esterase/lipase
MRHATSWIIVVFGCLCAALADEPDRTIEVWPGLAPGETTRVPGEALPQRAGENPPAMRIAKITQPLLEVYEPPAEKRNGMAVLILPGGGYNYVVKDKEGAEPARWLNGLGIAGFVLRYRTKDTSELPPWQRPLQDAQRAISLLRANAAQWKLNPQRIGILGFSAGGHAAALAATRFDERAYEPQDLVDKVSCRPDFAMLRYSGYLWNPQTGKLADELRISSRTPPTFLVHAHDDRVTPLSSVYFYAALKLAGVPAELHIYQTGGHGYGIRPVSGANIHTWPQRAEVWLSLLSTAGD